MEVAIGIKAQIGRYRLARVWQASQSDWKWRIESRF